MTAFFLEMYVCDSLFPVSIQILNFTRDEFLSPHCPGLIPAPEARFRLSP